MDKESILQAAEEEWLIYFKWSSNNVEKAKWPWFWLILAESIWPTPGYVSLGFVPLEYAQWFKEQEIREEDGE